MCFKNAWIVILLCFPSFLNAQIRVDDVGDGWKAKVDSAIKLIEMKNSACYDMLIENCTRVEFILGDRSTVKLPNTIAITTNDMQLNSINNIAAVLVHESYHLEIARRRVTLSPEKEEYEAYLHEYSFLCTLEKVEEWLFVNAMNQLIMLQKLQK
jgi:hypothetical protein